jgi:putative transposase
MGGRKFRLLNVIDDCNREMLAMEPDFSLPALKVIRVWNTCWSFEARPDDRCRQRSGIRLPRPR